MNNTTGETCSRPPFCISDLSWVANAVSLCLYLPPNIYILHLILSRKLITVEFFALIVALSEIFISLHDIFRILAVFFHFRFLFMAELFLLGFIFTSRPLLLMLICVERYLAVAKPVFFMRFKHFRYKLPLFATVWLLTILSGLGIILLSQTFYHIVTAEIIAICALKLHCCIATLYILKKPGPGEKAVSRDGMNSVKLKAFRIMSVITVSVILTYVPFISILLLANQFTKLMLIQMTTIFYVWTANSGLVQSLLFLYKYEKLPFVNFVKCL